MIFKQKLLIPKEQIEQAIKDLFVDEKVIAILNMRLGLEDNKEPVSLRAVAHRFGVNHGSIWFQEQKIAEYLKVSKLVDKVLI